MVQELERMTDGDMETMAAREAGHPNLVVGIGWTFFGSFESGWNTSSFPKGQLHLR